MARKKGQTYTPEQKAKVVLELLKEEQTLAVKVDTPNEVWNGDITYIRMNGGFMYLAAVIDWNTRALLAYKISNSMNVPLATYVLKMALNKYPSPKISGQAIHKL